jgi:hypothetical protein
MSQKIDSRGNVLGPYCEDDLRVVKIKGRQRKNRSQNKQRQLDYYLIWDITEMRVKIHIQGKFPKNDGPLIPQLAKERLLGQGEKIAVNESRSTALQHDIRLTHRGTSEEYQEENRDVVRDEDMRDEGIRDEDMRDEIYRLANAILGGGEFQSTDNESIMEYPTTCQEESTRLLTPSTQECPVVRNDKVLTPQPGIPMSTATAPNQPQFYEHAPETGVLGGPQQQMVPKLGMIWTKLVFLYNTILY